MVRMLRRMAPALRDYARPQRRAMSLLRGWLAKVSARPSHPCGVWGGGGVVPQV